MTFKASLIGFGFGNGRGIVVLSGSIEKRTLFSAF